VLFKELLQTQAFEEVLDQGSGTDFQGFVGTLVDRGSKHQQALVRRVGREGCYLVCKTKGKRAVK
jgi:hypothetical protein